MSRWWRNLTLLLIALSVASCVAVPRQSQCSGPWSPINPTPEVHSHG